jgi:hypothetical protein
MTFFQEFPFFGTERILFNGRVKLIVPSAREVRNEQKAKKCERDVLVKTTFRDIVLEVVHEDVKR